MLIVPRKVVFVKLSIIAAALYWAFSALIISRRIR